MSGDDVNNGDGHSPGGAIRTDAVNNDRRRFLIGATAAVGGVGVVGAAVPFVASWQPSAKARALGASIKVDVSKIGPGEMIGPIPAWRGTPVFVFRRSEEQLATLEGIADRLQDPDSERITQQPQYAQNVHRSRDPEIGVLKGLCTHLGCSPKYYGELEPQPFDPNWQGGFFCPCHGSRFDLAGRVYTGAPAPANLEVPPYRYESDNVIVIGEDEENA